MAGSVFEVRTYDHDYEVEGSNLYLTQASATKALANALLSDANGVTRAAVRISGLSKPHIIELLEFLNKFKLTEVEVSDDQSSLPIVDLLDRVVED